MSSSTPHISADEVNQAIVNKSDIVLLDVRTAGEFQREKIAGSINIPVDEVAAKVENILPDKNKTVYVYCLSGARSDMAADIMIQLGYKSVFSMTSGLLMWRSKNPFMMEAIEQAKEAKDNGDWPFGAVVILNGKIVGKGRAKDKVTHDITDHAELVAIREACKTLGTSNLDQCAIYCTNEPCLMCASGIFQAKISRIIIGASRDDLAHLLRPRKIRIEDLAEDAGHNITITRGVSKDSVLKLFEGIK